MARGASATPPDGGWGWVVMLASFFNCGVVFGFIKTGGVLYIAFVNHFLVSRTEAAFIPSLAFSISCLLAPFASSLSIRYSYRNVIFFGGFLSAVGLVFTAAFLHSYTAVAVSCGVITGLGCGLIVVPNIIVVHTYFDRHRAFASGFSLAGGSVGGLLMPPFIEWIIDNHGLFAAVLAMSAIMLHTCPLSLLFRPLGQQTRYRRSASKDLDGSPDTLLESKQSNAQNGNLRKEESYEDVHRSRFRRLLAAVNLDPSLFRRKYFYMISFSLMCFTYTWAGYLTLLPDYALHEAAEPVKPSMAALLLSFMCAGDVVFRIVSGWILDRGWIKRHHVYIILMYTSSVVLFCYTITQPYIGLVACSIILGVLVSGVIILPPVLIVDYLGPKLLPMAFGICTGIDGIVVMIAAPSLAYLRELTGSYKPCFVLMALGLFIPATVWLLDSILAYCRRSEQEVTADASVA